MTRVSDVEPKTPVGQLPAHQLISCDDISCELMVDPIPRPAPDSISITLKPGVARVTFLDHAKPNSSVIMKYAQDILSERGVEVAENILLKGDPSVRMAEVMLQSFSGEKGLVICGVSD